MTPICEPYLTAHAVERFQERIMDLTAEEIWDLILGTEEIYHALACGAWGVTHGAVTLITREGAVVTIYPAEWKVDAEATRRAKARPFRERQERGGYRKIQAANKAVELRARMGG